MNLMDIKNSITNVLETDRILSEANRIKLNARDGVGAKAERAAEIYDGRIVSPLIKNLLNEMKRQNRQINPEKIFSQIAEASEVVAREADVMENMLSDDARRIIMRETLNVKDAQLLEFISVADFFLAMSRTFMVAVTEAEIAQLRGESLEKASMNYYSKTFEGPMVKGFADCIAYFIGKKDDKIIEKIKDLPEIKVDQTVLDTIQSTEGRQKIDPAGLNILNIFNPIAWVYGAQKIWSEIKLKRLELNNDELEYLELRYQELLLERGDRSNPQLEEKIRRYQDSIQIKRTKIERLKKNIG